MNFERIKQIIEEYSDIVEFGQGISDFWIEKAQDRLEVKFPPSYIWWLKNYGGGEINGEEIFSIYELDFDTVVGGDIVYINELNRKNGISVNSHLTIQENDQGESYYINLEERDMDGECPVYIDLNSCKYADNFLDFIEKKILE